jgi:hypothetical protein
MQEEKGKGLAANKATAVVTTKDHGIMARCGRLIRS